MPALSRACPSKTVSGIIVSYFREARHIAIYLASREAAVMTGQDINIDGGRLMA